MQKLQAQKPAFMSKAFFKFFLYMKLSIILAIASMQAFSAGYSQGDINLTLKDARIKKALTVIQKASSYRFIYNDEIIPDDIRVNISVHHAAIQDVLNLVFKSTSLTYKILESGLIVVTSVTEKEDIVVDFPVKGTIRLRNMDGSLTSSPGIAIKELGTSNGTNTGNDGEYSLIVRDKSAVLEVSHVGYKTAQVPIDGRSVVDIVLEPVVSQLQEVVVTALGISRQKKSLTYATQTIKGNDLSETRDVNLTSAMNGKVANMLISKTNAGPGSSNRIIFRGNRSITGNNQPLVIVDGVRIDNTPKAFTDVTGNVGLTRDNGDGISNINPDDVETVTVLTGASAAALYGSDASNGAIIVTTKKGKSGNGIGIQIASSLNLENPMILPKFQNMYGQGLGNNFAAASDQSWGAKMDGQFVTDWTGKTQALTPQPDNVKDFFQTGSEFINSVAISAGNDKSQTYFSYTNTLSKGILPNNEYKRNNLNLRQTTQVAKNLSMDFKANYLVEDIVNRPLAGAANHALVTILSMPRSLRIQDIRNYESIDPSDFSEKQNYWASSPPN
ncbi:MAG TPA: TonB-dependent receptor plug domain-containing protein, partial [Puia sp.]|nr:TonB-dependent receptor plug domain-containing protein [Puia sp.]